MISFLSSWVKNLSLALIIVSILEMILPNNKTKKYVKTIMGLYILFSIISPFINNNENINLNNINLNFYTENIDGIEETYTVQVDQTSMDERLNEIYKEELEKDIKQKIEKKGYSVEECSVKAYVSQSEDDNGIQKITLKLNKIEENSEQSESIEDKIVTEIQKIQKVDIKINNQNQNENEKQNEEETNESENKMEEKTNITKTDIKIIQDFIKEEYGVGEECLKIS